MADEAHALAQLLLGLLQCISGADRFLLWRGHINYRWLDRNLLLLQVVLDVFVVVHGNGRRSIPEQVV